MPTTIPPIVITIDTERTHGVQPVKERMVNNAREAVDNFGTRGEAFVKAISPVRTGYMKSQAKHESDGHEATVYVDGNLHTETGAFYSIYVEHGTRNRAPNPFFWPSIRAARKLFVEDMRRVFR